MSTQASEQQIVQIPVSKVAVFQEQPRKYFNPISIQFLTESIREIGQLMPGLVRRLDPPQNGCEYELIEGERRLKACIAAEVNFFRAEVIQVTDVEDQFKKSVVANFNREEHPPLECAHAIDRLKKSGNTDLQIAAMVGKSITWVYQHHSLLRLDPEVLKRMDPALDEQFQLKYTIALKLVPAPRDYQIKLAETIIKMRLGMKEATHMIEKTLRSGGVQKGMAPNRKEFKKMLTVTTRANSELDLLLDTTEDQLRTVLRSRPLQDRMTYVEQLETMSLKAGQIKERIEKILRAS
jgi:ParB/RepB/Spo0J family partition protein